MFRQWSNDRLWKVKCAMIHPLILIFISVWLMLSKVTAANKFTKIADDLFYLQPHALSGSCLHIIETSCWRFRQQPTAITHFGFAYSWTWKCVLRKYYCINVNGTTCPMLCHDITTNSLFDEYYYIMAGCAFVVAKEVVIMETVVFWHCDDG